MINKDISHAPAWQCLAAKTIVNEKYGTNQQSQNEKII